MRAGVAELADAPDLGSGAPAAYEFKSLRPHQFSGRMPEGSPMGIAPLAASAGIV